MKNLINNESNNQHAVIQSPEGREETTWSIEESNKAFTQEATDFLSSLGIVKDGSNDEEFEDDHFQVLGDLRVIDLVKSVGGDLSIENDVRHSAYFQRKSSAKAYLKELIERGFQVGKVERIGKGSEYLVRFCHCGKLEKAAISMRTLALSRLASKQRGKYVGWEVTVNRKKSILLKNQQPLGNVCGRRGG